jgi:1-phosphofructokinase
LSIVTVTLNPALDLTGNLPHVDLGSLNRIETSNMHASGKGINVAVVASNLNTKVTATGILGQNNQAPFVALFSQNNITDQFIRVPGNTRINVKLIENSDQTTELNFPGLTIQPQSIKDLETKIIKLLVNNDIFVLSGSLPESLPSNTWAKIITPIVTAGKVVLFDSSGLAIAEGIKALPTFIKPNETELSTLMGRDTNSAEYQQKAAEQLLKLGIKNVVISKGKNGVSWFQDKVLIQAIPPKVKVVNTVGAGDSLVAGMAVGLSYGLKDEEVLRMACAVAAIKITQIDMAIKDSADIEKMKQQVTIKRFSLI